LSTVLPAESEHGGRPVHTGHVTTQSSDPALVTQLPKPNHVQEGKRQAQDGVGEGFPKKADKE